MMNLDELRNKIRWTVELDPRKNRQIADDAGVGILTLYGCYRPNGIVSLQSLTKVCDHLGFKLTFNLEEKS